MPYKWKNKFVSEKVYKAMLKRVENGKKRRKIDEKEKGKKIARNLTLLSKQLEARMGPEIPVKLSPENQPADILKKIMHLCEKLTASVNEVSSISDTAETNHSLEGNRIINTGYLSKQLECSFCHEPLLLKDIQKEVVQGLASTFDIRCRKCYFVKKIHSVQQYENSKSGKLVYSINTQVALGN